MDQPPFDVETLIAEVAKRHKLLLAPEDPAFALVTLNELVLSRLVTLLEARLAGMENTLSQISAKQTETAKAIGENIISAAAVYVAQRLEDAGSSLLSRTLRAKEEEDAGTFGASIFAVPSIVGAFAAGLAISAVLHHLAPI